MKIYRITREIQNGEGIQPFLPPPGSDVYVGIDMHRKHWSISIAFDGVIIFRCSAPGEWEVLRRLLDRYKTCKCHCVYEAGYFGYWLHKRLESVGAGCIVTPPGSIPRESNNRVKTDRVDSDKLAIFLSKGLLKAVAVPTKEELGHREVVRRRIQLVQGRVGVQLRIKAFLNQYGIPFPEIKGRWSNTFIEHLQALSFDDYWLQISFKSLLTEFDNLTVQIETHTKLIHELAKMDRYRDQVAILKTIPGIGILIGMEILVELQDVHRFPSGAQLTAYVGLTPSQHSSGEHIRMGNITGMGKSHLRSMLVEACWILISKDDVMKKKYNAIKHRAGSKRAIVAIARKLLIRVRRVLLDRTPYVSGRAA